jgi:N-acetyl-gamma-glutamyl-phosphate reductase
LDPSTPLTVNAVSGYSGGGKALIESYASLPAPQQGADAARPLAIYGLDSRHKHLAEMQLFSLLEHPPLFVPAVAPAYCGMIVSTPVPRAAFKNGATAREVFDIWADQYADSPMVEPHDPQDLSALRDGRYLDLAEIPDRNSIQLMAFGDDEIGLVLIARLDNLGKGAAGNAVQCVNLMLGFKETVGLSA